MSYLSLMLPDGDTWDSLEGCTIWEVFDADEDFDENHPMECANKIGVFKKDGYGRMMLLIDGTATDTTYPVVARYTAGQEELNG